MFVIIYLIHKKEVAMATKKEVADIVRANIANIEEGQIYPSIQKLSNALSLKVDSNNKNIIYDVIRQFIHFEKTGSGHSIKIVHINPNANVLDGRITNGGANNVKYQSQVYSAILNFDFKSYGQYIFTKDFYKNVLMFPDEYIENANDDSINISNYKYYLRNYLSSISRTSLRSLSKKGYITFNLAYVSISEPQISPNCIPITNETRFSDIYSRDVISDIKSLIPQLTEETTLAEVLYYSKKHDVETQRALHQYFAGNSSKYEQLEVLSDNYSDFFDDIEKLLSSCLSLGNKYRYIYNDAIKIYQYENNSKYILGFDKVYTAWQISTKTDNITINLPTYSLNDFLKTIEPTFIKQLNSTYWFRTNADELEGIKKYCNFDDAQDVVDFHNNLFGQI